MFEEHQIAAMAVMELKEYCESRPENSCACCIFWKDEGEGSWEGCFFGQGDIPEKWDPRFEIGRKKK